MSTNQAGQQQIQLPPVIKFVMPSQHAVLILDALSNYVAPHKDVNPVFQNLQQQLFGQQVLPPSSLPSRDVNEILDDAQQFAESTAYGDAAHAAE